MNDQRVKVTILWILVAATLFLQGCWLSNSQDISEPEGSSIQPIHLLCGYLQNPLGVDDREPLLSWRLEAKAGVRGVKQSAYRVLVSCSPERLAAGNGDLWDSGKISSEQQLFIPYEGKPLMSQKRYYWKVRVWDQDGERSGWSEISMWSMGSA